MLAAIRGVVRYVHAPLDGADVMRPGGSNMKQRNAHKHWPKKRGDTNAEDHKYTTACHRLYSKGQIEQHMADGSWIKSKIPYIYAISVPIWVVSQHLIPPEYYPWGSGGELLLGLLFYLFSVVCIIAGILIYYNRHALEIERYEMFFIMFFIFGHSFYVFSSILMWALLFYHWY